MSISPIWKLLEESKLVSPEKCQELGEEFQRQQPPTATINDQSIAAWLVGQKVISSYQATVLQAGLTGPFDYGDYRVDDRVSSGPRQGTFRAIHLPTRKRVALRFVEAAADSRSWQELLQRIGQRSAIQHLCLTRSFEARLLPQYRFVAVNDRQAETLRDYLQQKKRLSVKRACLIVHQLASALAAAHSVHQTVGNLQPENILIDSQGTVEIWWDPTFSNNEAFRALRQAPAEEQTAAAKYWAPELANPDAVPSPLTDIYALGCLFYELLSGRPPFQATRLDELLRQHANDPIASLESLEVPGAVEKIVSFMMAKNPEVRYQSAEKVEAQFAKLLKSSKSKQPPKIPPVDEQESTFRQWLKVHRESVEAVSMPVSVSSETGAAPANAETVVVDPATSIPATNESPFAGLAQSADANSAGGSFIQTGDDHRLARARQRKPTTSRPIMLVAAALLLLGSAAALWALFGRGNGPAADNDRVANSSESENSPSPTATNDTDEASADATPTSFEQEIVTDPSDDMLWETPTQGPPPELDFVPGGLRVLVLLRPAAILSLEEGQRLKQGFGPDFANRLAEVEKTIGVPLSDVDRLLIGFHDNGGAKPRPSYRVTLSEPHSLESLAASWGAAAEDTSEQRRRYVDADSGNDILAWGIDEEEQTIHYLVAAPEDITSVVDVAGAPPLLRLEFKQLLRFTDTDRHASILAIPTSLFNDEGRQLFAGPTRQLLEPLESITGDSVAACGVSFHLDQSLYLETMLKGTLDIEPLQLAQALQERVNRQLGHYSTFVFTLASNPYWDQLRMQFKSWIDLLQSNSRYGVEEQIVFANCWLPLPAAHNLAIASELSLASTGGGSAPSRTTSASDVPQSMEELLDAKFTIEIPRNDLVLIIDELRSTVKNKYRDLPFEFDIKMLGNDLQLEGITQNQSVSDFNKAETPLREILTDLMARAFKAPGVDGPDDPNFMLIWAIGTDPDQPSGPPKLLITTRVAAKREGYQVPKEFKPSD